MVKNLMKKVIAGLCIVPMLLAIGGAAGMQEGLDLKKLIDTRTDELIKLAQDLKVDTSTLAAFKQAFKADQLNAAIKSLNAFPAVVTVFAILGKLKKLEEATLQAGLYKLIAALELFLETVKQQETKICVALYLTEKKKEQIVGPFLNEAPKEISGTVPLKLQEQQCI